MAAIWANQIKNQSGSVTKNVSTLVDSLNPPLSGGTLSLAGGWTTADAPYNRALGYTYSPVTKTVTLYGAVKRGSGAGDGIAALPANFSPPITTGFPVAISGSTSVSVILGSNQAGTGQINAPGGSSTGDIIFFDGVSFYIG